MLRTSISASDKFYDYSSFEFYMSPYAYRNIRSALFMHAAYCCNTAMFDLARNVARG